MVGLVHSCAALTFELPSNAAQKCLFEQVTEGSPVDVKFRVIGADYNVVPTVDAEVLNTNHAFRMLVACVFVLEWVVRLHTTLLPSIQAMCGDLAGARSTRGASCVRARENSRWLSIHGKGNSGGAVLLSPPCKKPRPACNDQFLGALRRTRWGYDPDRAKRYEGTNCALSTSLMCRRARCPRSRGRGRPPHPTPHIPYSSSFFSSRRRHTRSSNVTGVQTCAFR
eukprot:SAG11_NODE_4999_length_1696_cov_2.316218_1_plen_224_part_10